MAKSDRPSAADNIGPHLLGRKKTDPDARDFQAQGEAMAAAELA